MSEGFENPKAKFLCNKCYDKDVCEQTISDQIYCKLNQMNMNLANILKEVKK